MSDRLQAIYDRVPALTCKRECARFCTTGPISMGQVEWDSIVAFLGHAPRGDRRTWTCPLLDGTRCTVYPVRPLICRMWGAADGMACPQGCKPERWISQAGGSALLNEVYAIAGQSYDLWGKDVYDYYKGARLMKLSIGDRITLLQVLKMAQLEGNVTTLKQVRQVREELSFDDAEHASSQLRLVAVCPNEHPPVEIPALQAHDLGVCPVCKAPRLMSHWKWDAPGDPYKDVAIGDAAKAAIIAAFKQLDMREKMREDWLPLYERFVEDKEKTP